MRISHLSSVLGAALIAASAAACRRAAPVVAATSVASVNQDSVRLARARADSIARADADARARLARDRAVADSVGRAAALRDSLAAAREALTIAVHFEFDRAELTDADRALLDRKAAVLRRSPSIRIRAEGNADERGSDEYNLALGMRRAAVVKAYLMGHGVDATRIEIVSNGEERRTCSEPAEPCWAANRRAEFVIVAGQIRGE